MLGVVRAELKEKSMSVDDYWNSVLARKKERSGSWAASKQRKQEIKVLNAQRNGMASPEQVKELIALGVEESKAKKQDFRSAEKSIRKLTRIGGIKTRDPLTGLMFMGQSVYELEQWALPGFETGCPFEPTISGSNG